MTRSEGEQLLGSARDYFRVEFSKTKDIEATKRHFTEAAEKGEFEGKYYRVVGEVKRLPDGRFELKTNNHDDQLQVGVIRFSVGSGSSEIEWFNGDPD
ncbi:MAG: hypothetical protein KDB82_06025 [Planctomycetes bacterium]|nr:hypothetical protein [Planctomycetota bacterium]